MQTVMGDAWMNIGYADSLLSPYQPPDEPLNTSLLGSIGLVFAVFFVLAFWFLLILVLQDSL